MEELFSRRRDASEEKITVGGMSEAFGDSLDLIVLLGYGAGNMSTSYSFASIFLDNIPQCITLA